MKDNLKRHQETLLGFLKGYSHPVILTHYDPDGDALGSALAISLFLEKKVQHNVPVIIPNEAPYFLKWLPGNQNILTFFQQEEDSLKAMKEADCFFLIDFNSLTRLKKLANIYHPEGRPVILIDHHPNPSIPCDLCISEVEVSSTSELIYKLIETIGDKDLIDKEIAINLFTGIMTDTGCFSFNSSYPDTWRIVSELLNHSIDKDYIFSRIYENYSENRMRLMGYCLNEKMVILHESQTAYISLTKEELKEYQFEPGDSEGFVNLPFSIKGIRITALFIEKEDHIKISFRSKGLIPINGMAEKYFAGGGHRNAAGGESNEDMDTTIARFIEIVRNYARQVIQ